MTEEQQSSVPDNQPTGDSGAAPEAPANDSGAAPEAPAFTLPEQYSKEVWAEGIKSQEDLFAKMSELHTKATREITAEDIAKFRPADPSEYEVGEYFEEGSRDGIKQILHEAGLTKEQAKLVMNGYEAFDKKQQAELFGEQGFTEEMNKSFKGDQTIVKEVAGALAKSLNPEDKALLDGMPNAVVGLVYRAASSLIKGYGVQEGGPAHSSAPSTPATPEARRAEATRLWGEMDAAKAKGNFAEMRAIQERVNQLYKG